ncbi:MAG: hypothetical protein AB1489_25775, partial [Acidobacteriota bacterium]
MSKKRVILLVLCCWLVVVGGSSKIIDSGVKADNDQQDSQQSKGKIRPQAGNGCGTDFLFDLPWRIDPATAFIPMVLEIKDENYSCGGQGLDVGWDDPMYVEIRDFSGGPNIAEENRPWIAYGGPYTEANFESVSNDTKFFHFKVPRPSWWVPGNTYFIQAKFRYKEQDLFFDDDAYFLQVLRVYYAATKLPRFANEPSGNWYYGDLHWHGQWTDSEAESGGSYWFLARAADVIGIDWSVASEHASNSTQIGSSDPRDVGPNEWSYVKSGSATASTYGKFKLYPAEEIDVKQQVDAGQSFYLYGDNKRYPATGSLSVKYQDNRYVLYDSGIPSDSPSRNHLIAVPTDGVYVDGKLDTYGGGTKYLDNTLNTLNGFCYIAHALANSPNKIIGDIVPVTPRQLETSFNSPKVYGTEVWNEDQGHGTNGGEDIVYTADNDNVIQVNPFRWNNTAKVWEWEYSSLGGRAERERDMLAHWIELLMKGLRQQVSWAVNSTHYYRKMFFAGGSDSHGDVNYKSYGNLYDQLGDGVLSWNAVNSSGFAEPRNLVLARSNSLADIQQALSKGRYLVTNGPILDIGIDMNNDGLLTEGTDYRMGDTASLNALLAAGKAKLTIDGFYELTILVRLSSTAEFGSVSANNVEIIGRDSDGVAVPGVLLSSSSTGDSIKASYKVLVRANTKGYGGLEPGCFFFALIRTHVDGITDLHDREFDGLAITNPVWLRFNK